jgi:hypothetical protein
MMALLVFLSRKIRSGMRLPYPRQEVWVRATREDDGRAVEE